MEETADNKVFKFLLVADIAKGDKGEYLYVTRHCTNGNIEYDEKEFVSGTNLEEIVNESIKKINEEYPESVCSVVFSEELVSVISSSNVAQYKESVEKNIINLKKKNMELLSDETCVLDNDTKSSLLKSLTVLDKVISIING